jgi:hypothetical protein
MERLKIIAADDPVPCAIYAHENDLLDKLGWKHLKHIAKLDKKFTCMVNQVGHRTLHQAATMDMRSQGHTYKPFALISKMGTLYREMLPPYSSPRLMILALSST